MHNFYKNIKLNSLGKKIETCKIYTFYVSCCYVYTRQTIYLHSNAHCKIFRPGKTFVPSFYVFHETNTRIWHKKFAKNCKKLQKFCKKLQKCAKVAQNAHMIYYV